MSWMIFIFNVLMALATNGANEGMTGSDLNQVHEIWRNSQPVATSQVKPIKAGNTRARGR